MTEHSLRGVHFSRPASGTGEHQHHRANIVVGGKRIGYWACALAKGGPCGALPPPVPPPVDVPPPVKPCPRGHPLARMRIRPGTRHSRRCLECELTRYHGRTSR